MSNIKSFSAKNNTNYIIILIILILVGAYVIYALTRPMPKLTIKSNDITSPTYNGNFVWPSYGQSAIGAKGYGVLSTHGEQIAKPIASIAKTILALAITKERPLALGEQGPNIPITQIDIDLYNDAVKNNGSNVPVTIGENLSQYQALQALLIPSGDNIAETLAIWAFGSQQQYLDYANNMVANWGLTNTRMADASGLSPQTVSSAHDLIIIGEKIMNDPVLSKIVSQQDVELPVVGKVKNYNTLLGQNGVTGIKTGNTDEAGGCLLFSYTKQIDQKDTVLIGVILGASSRYQALIDTTSLIKNNDLNYKYFNIVKKDQIIGTAKTAWDKDINIVAKNDLTVLMVPGEKVEITPLINEINKTLNKNTEVGKISAKYLDSNISVPVILDEKIPTPPILWRLFHL
jgi:D-alanyl-D-alanine carboxypeptidase (penicillin-binding protein 5/6)